MSPKTALFTALADAVLNREEPEVKYEIIMAMAQAHEDNIEKLASYGVPVEDSREHVRSMRHSAFVLMPLFGWYSAQDQYKADRRGLPFLERLEAPRRMTEAYRAAWIEKYRARGRYLVEVALSEAEVV